MFVKTQKKPPEMGERRKVIMQNYIIQLTGMFGRQDDPDVAFKAFIGPGSLDDLVGWLRKNGFTEGPLWMKKR